MQKIEYPISQTAQKFIDAFHSLPDNIRMEIKGKLCLSVPAAKDEIPTYEGFKQGPIPAFNQDPIPIQALLAQGINLCPTCGKPIK